MRLSPYRAAFGHWPPGDGDNFKPGAPACPGEIANMKERKINSVFFSPCGGVKNVMRALMKNVNAPVREHDITLPKGRDKDLSFAQDDFVFFGFPVYGGRMPVNIEKLFKHIRGEGAPCVLVAVYGNRAFEGALLDLHKAASGRGFIPIAAIAAIAEHSLAPQLAAGRPDEEDQAKLADWGVKILEFESNGLRLASAPGKYPDWVIPQGVSPYPITDREKCIKCGICAEVCPTAAIPVEEPWLTDDANCVICGACAKYCPENARIMGNKLFHDFGKPHLAEAAIRKEPQLFCS